MNNGSTLPQIIQGGMGVGVSSWALANAVSRAGQLGVVSGAMLDTVLVRRLQDGDPGGHVQRAARHFPDREVAESIVRRFLRYSTSANGPAYALLPMLRQRMTIEREQLIMLANFVEVWLARDGHTNAVGINLLTKAQLPNMASLYGAMLAGVDCVIMGAGIPREIPGVLDALATHRVARMRFDVEGVRDESVDFIEFDPARHWRAGSPVEIRRPTFIAIVSAASLAATLARKSNGKVDGFIVEGPTAGGHNAPPRGRLRVDDNGEPVYGERDVVDLAAMRDLHIPFWLAGGMGSQHALARAHAAGAAGIQVGTIFALCDESGIAPTLKHEVLHAMRAGTASVATDPRASPTGYPFKVVSIANRVEAPRQRLCDLGYLRSAVRTEKGVVYRCPAEPVDTYVAKGGHTADTEGRKCLCNGLLSTVGLAQLRKDDTHEPALVTSGDDLPKLKTWIGDRSSYSAADALSYLLATDSVARFD